MFWKNRKTSKTTTMAKWLTMVVTMLCVACSNDGFEYSDYHCNMQIDNSAHLDVTLASAMNALSPGIFCRITYKMEGGAKLFVFDNNQNAHSTKVFNAIDERLTAHLHLGMNNGLIVGYGNLDNPAVFYAYDLQCPNCFDPEAIPVVSRPLTMSTTGVATCNVCHRQYNMNTGGNIIAGEKGRPLSRYRATTTGPNGVLHVY